MNQGGKLSSKPDNDILLKQFEHMQSRQRDKLKSSKKRQFVFIPMDESNSNSRI